MVKFCEIKLITACGYFLLFVCSFIGFAGGRGLPHGLILIPIPSFIELGFTIYYTKISIRNKSVHFLCFSILIFIFAFSTGMGINIYKDNIITKHLLNANNIVEEYRIRNNIDILSEEDYSKLILPENIRINILKDKHEISYNDGVYWGILYDDRKIYIWSPWRDIY